MSDSCPIVLSENQEIIKASGVNTLLSNIRPQWKAKNLIQRVIRILPVDPSSACQRIFNAAIHDLKEKIVVAGIDIAGEAARQYKLPKIERAEDVERLHVTHTIDLSYNMGLLSRPEWRRIHRVYDIRRDLEHEDDEYEAEIEDCFYTFKTCVDVVLAKDPIQVIKLTDIKEIVEQPVPSTFGQTVLDDYEFAPQARQLDIYKFLISSTLNNKYADIIRQNCYNALNMLCKLTNKQVIIHAASDFQTTRLGRRCPTTVEARVAVVAGILPYLKQSSLKDLFTTYYSEMESIGHSFKNYEKHRELLCNFKDLGGLDFCPDEMMLKIIKWLILCYIGEPSYGPYSSSRRVFYSNVGAPLSLEILTITYKDIYETVVTLRKNDEKIKRACINNKHVEKRFQEILDNIRGYRQHFANFPR